jgi:lipopolysaccharide transport system ATP-binding protein
MQPIIQVEGVSKKYRIGTQEPYGSLRDTIADLFKPGAKKPSKEFWALRDISFTLNQGDSLGIIGRNGAGKSTLLKILSQITPPTTGKITMNGRVASLLEVGTGFNPELTGRENIYLNGAILGMSRAEINKKFDEIVAFSGVEKFLDTPVKRYSSGMYVRLAFSVAAHLEPEVLIVDEVLAVGDTEFQKKCLDKMDQVTREEGRTILFVSHNLLTVQQLCKKVILLENGKVKHSGEPADVIEKYTTNKAVTKVGPAEVVQLADAQNNAGEIRFTGIKISNRDGDAAIASDDKLRFTMNYRSDYKVPITDSRVVITVFSERSDQIVLRLDTDVTAQTPDELAPKGELICETDKLNLSEGSYVVDVDFILHGSSVDLVKKAAKFEVYTDIKKYNYKTHPDRSITDHVIKYSFKQG